MSDPMRDRLPLALGFAVILVELGLTGVHTLASWRSVGADAAPTLRTTLGLVSSDGAPPSPALRPRDDLAREAQPFILTARSAAERRRAVQCLANAVYYEAALEPLEGQRAVAQVVLNRVRDIDYPHSICGVVYQGWARRTGCQFSFTCNGALDRAPVAAAYARARGVAEAALDGYVMAEVGTATHYHTADIDPWWRPTLARVAQVGAHIFYAWTRTSGVSGVASQHYQGGELRLPQAVVDGRILRRTDPIAATAHPPIGVSDATSGKDRAGVMQDRPRSAIPPNPANPT